MRPLPTASDGNKQKSERVYRWWDVNQREPTGSIFLKSGIAGKQRTARVMQTRRAGIGQLRDDRSVEYGADKDVVRQVW